MIVKGWRGAFWFYLVSADPAVFILFSEESGRPRVRGMQARPPVGERIFEPYRAAVNSSVCSGPAFADSMEVLPRDVEEEGRGFRAIILWGVFIHGV